MGNTCYFNSLVHIYNSLPPFRNIILRLPWREPSMVDPPEVVALLELQRLFGFLSVSPRRYQDPTTLVKLLVEARGPGAKLGTQEDPTEFNLHFLKQIRSGIKRLDAEAHRKISEYDLLHARSRSWAFIHYWIAVSSRARKYNACNPRRRTAHPPRCSRRSARVRLYEHRSTTSPRLRHSPLRP